MWDLETIHHMEHVQQQEWLQQQAEAGNLTATLPEVPVVPQRFVENKPVWPLSELTRKMLYGPVYLGALIDLLENGELERDFHKLVREYLPEQEREIMGQKGDDRIVVFARYFSSRYFPLSDMNYEDTSLESFLAQIPVDLMGFSYTDYHNFADFRAGYILMMSLVAYPYRDGWENEKEFKNRNKATKPVGARVPILEAVTDMLGCDIVNRLPVNGYTPQQMHAIVDGTKYAGVADFLDWVCSSTPCMVLNANYEDYGPEEWGRQVVEDLTKEWPQVVAIQERIMKMATWLENHDNRGGGMLRDAAFPRRILSAIRSLAGDANREHFEELVHYLVRHKAKQNQTKAKRKPKEKTLIDIFTEEEVEHGNEENGKARIRRATSDDLAALAVL